MTTTTMAAKIKRSSIPDIRKAMLDRGALLFRFEKPSNVNHKREHIVWFEQMQEAGFIVTTLLGIAGSLLATYGGRLLNIYPEGSSAGFIASVIGAIIVLFIYNLVTKKS